MKVQFELVNFNSQHARSFYKLLNWYGITYQKSTNINRIITFERDFELSKYFIDFCKDFSKKYIERKTQKFGVYDKFYVDLAINNITQPYIAVFTLYSKKM